MNRPKLIIFLVLIILFILAGCSPKPAINKISPSSIEPIPDSEFSRIILTAKASERLGIETAQVSRELASRTKSIRSEVITLTDADNTSANNYWVKVSLSENQKQMVDRSAPVSFKPLEDDDEDNGDNGDIGSGLFAEYDDGQDFDDSDGEFSTLYYKLPADTSGVSIGQQLLLEVPFIGNGKSYLVVPYAAVIYGVHGETWVYTNPEPLVFVRAPITVDFIQGDWAFLSEGPEVGTSIVTIGNQELFGTETGVSK